MKNRVSVESLMTQKVIQIESDKTVADAIDEMKKTGVGKLVVTQKGRPLVLLEEWRIFSIDPAKKLEDVMKNLEPVTTILEGTPIDEAKRLLADKPALIVMSQENKMIGIITIEDFIGYLKKAL
jgi:predicted transcriptional regulator